MRNITLWGAACAFALAAGCATTEYSDSSAADQALEDQVRAKIDSSRELAWEGPNIHVHAHRGTVRLRGHVRSERDREIADTLVRDTSGVVQVDDRLRLGGSDETTFSQEPVAVPVYSTAPPVYSIPPHENAPEPMLVPGYANLKIQAATQADEPLASRVAAQLHVSAVPQNRYQDVTVTIVAGNVELQGTADMAQHQAIIASIQQVTGVKAIYDQLEVR